MLVETYLDHLPVWLMYVLTALLLMVGGDIGFGIGTRRKARMQEGEKAPANAIMGSALGLLAFMLAFTFGMSAARFDARRNLVLEEASAVLRTYQRAQFLPEPQKTACSRLLSDYVGVRSGISQQLSLADVEKAVLRSETIQNELWKQATDLSDRPTAILAGFIQSLSELTDLQMKRVRAAVWNRIPSSILSTLYIVAVLAMTAMGYGAGLAGSRSTIPKLMLVLAFSAIIVLIVDLERPRQQLFRVNQEPMADVARRIESLQP